MIEQVLQGHLEELRVMRENAIRPRTDRGVGPEEGGEGAGSGDTGDNGDEDSGSVPGAFPPSPTATPTPEPPPSDSRPRERSPPQEYHGMYS